MQGPPARVAHILCQDCHAVHIVMKSNAAVFLRNPQMRSSQVLSGSTDTGCKSYHADTDKLNQNCSA